MAILINDIEYSGNVSDVEKKYWNGKYSKPSNGIPYNDMSDGVKDSLNKADESMSIYEGAYADTIAPQWYHQTEYKVGNIVIWNYKLWKCLLDNKGIEPAYNSDYWIQITLTDVLSELNSNLTWKYHDGGNYNSKRYMPLPTTYNELLVVISKTSNFAQAAQTIVPKIQMEDNVKRSFYMGGDYVANWTGGFSGGFTIENNALNGFWTAEAGIYLEANERYIKVYYR